MESIDFYVLHDKENGYSVSFTNTGRYSSEIVIPHISDRGTAIGVVAALNYCATFRTYLEEAVKYNAPIDAEFDIDGAVESLDSFYEFINTLDGEL